MAAQHAITTTVLMLVVSSVFMAFASYGHPKGLGSKPWIIAAPASCGIALSLAASSPQ